MAKEQERDTWYS